MLFREIWVSRKYNFFDEELQALAAPTIIDAGANIGMASLYFRHVCPRATITAIEPFPPNYQLLVHNVLLENVRTLQCSVGLTDGESDFYYNTSRQDSFSMGRRGMETNTSV